MTVSSAPQTSALKAETPASRIALGARFGLHAILILGALLMVAPFAVMLVVSLISTRAFMARDFGLENFTLASYAEVFRAVPFARYYLNSIVVASSVTVLQLLVSSLAAFAFARLRFKGRETLFLAYLATLMIPFPVTLIPNYLIINRLGWYDSFAALIVPSLFAVFSTFLLRQYYRGLPLDLDEAARIDGASSLRIWWQVVVPLSGPVLATLAIFVFQATWNDFLWPLVVTTSEEMRTIPVGLASFVGQYATAWSLLMAGSVIALLPVLILYVLGQNWFVRGIALTGMGGR